MKTARALSLRALSKSYLPGQNAVETIDLDIQPGEFVSFLGPSGSGKTTTLMMIAGFEKPTSGEIAIGGCKIDSVEPYDRNIGMVFQNYALFPHMTVAENVGFPLRMRSVARIEARKRIADALAMVGLADFADRKPAALSGGQQQRVALARALVFEPDVVLLDEPLGALDKALREHMQIELKRIHRELGVTMIYVTHDQAEAMAMSDRIAVFNRGRIEQVDCPADIYALPKTRFVASFIGDSNLLQGRIVQSGTIDLGELGQFPTADKTIPVNSTVHVLIRPEIIRLSPLDASHDTKALVVDELIHYGDSLLVLGKIADQGLRIRIAGNDIQPVERGQRYSVSWAPERMHIVEAAR